MNLKAYVDYRRKQLEHEQSQRPAALMTGIGFGGASLIAFDDYYKGAFATLNELQHLADWVGDGEPQWTPPPPDLTDRDKEHWRWVRDNGYEVPEHIAEQL